MNTQPTPTPMTRRRKRRAMYAALGLALAPVAVYAYDALNVSIPIMPAVGENAAGACDTNGVSTSYTYGATTNNGIRVSAATVSGIAPECTTGTLSFMNGTTAVATYSGTVTAGTLNLTTSVWTNDFTSVRVALFP